MPDSAQNIPEGKESPELMVDARSMLVINVGEIVTRALLFDSVENRYRLLGQAAVRTTAAAPVENAGVSIRSSIQQLQSFIGRRLLNQNGTLISPSTTDGSGVDQVAATLSAGPPLKIAAAGLLEEVSLASAKKLARTTFSGEMETISLNTIKDQAAQIDAILQFRPDLVIVAGGTDQGAAQSVLRLFETVHMACKLIPVEERPTVLFAGNQNLRGEIIDRFSSTLDIQFATNIRPTMDTEDFSVSQKKIASITRRIQLKQINGLDELDDWTNGRIVPSPSALGNIIRFLSKARTPKKGVLGIEIGASATTVAAAFCGTLTISVFPELGLGSDLTTLLEPDSFEKVTRWLSMHVPVDYMQAYILNKHLYPSSIPATPDDLAIEHALARYLIRTAILKNIEALSPNHRSSGQKYLPSVEPILATGSVLSQAPSKAHTLLMLLDGLQPVGATTFVLDPYQSSAALGAAAEINPTLTIQVLDSNAFLHMGTVISPVGVSKTGTPILRAELIDGDGHETRVEIKQGTILSLPLAAGHTAQLKLHPLHKYDVGMGGPGIGGTLLVKGGESGIVIDGRGRPLSLPANAEERYEMFHKWLWALGG